MAPDMRLLDPVVALTYLAAHTSRIRLGTGVNSLPYHHPLALAKRSFNADTESIRGIASMGMAALNLLKLVPLNANAPMSSSSA